MKSTPLILLTLALSPLNPFFQSPLHAKASESIIAIPVDPQLTKGQLANGLNYYILPNKHPAQKAELRLVIHAGSLNESEQQRGLAHFLEHMAFNGTKNFPKQTLVDQLQKMGVQFGADLNAYTGFNETVYILPIPLNEPNNLSIGMQILEDWGFNMSLKDADIQQERNIIIEESRIHSQNPQSEIQDKNIGITFNQTLFPKRLPIGDLEVIKHFAPQTLRDFYQDWYRPELMSVIVVGDVSVAETKKLIETHFSNKTSSRIMREQPNTLIPNNPQPLIGLFNHKDLPQSTVSLYQKEKADSQVAYTVEGYQRDLKHRIISQIINERLAALQENQQTPFTAAYSGFGFLDGIGLSKNSYVVSAMAKAGQEEAALKALHLENQRIIQHGVTQAELERAKRNLLANTENYFNNRDKVESSNKAEEYVRAAIEKESTPSIDWEYATTQKYLSNLTLNEVNQQARVYFMAENRIVLVNSNQEKMALNEASVKQIIDSQPSTQANQSSKSVQALLKTIPKSGRIVNSSYDSVLDMTTWQLSNGATVRFKKTDFKELISMNAYSDGGYSQIPDDVWRKTQWAYKGISEMGVNGHSSTEVTNLLAGKLVNIRTDINADSQGLHGGFAPKDIETAFQLMYSHITGTNHDPAGFERYVQRGISATKNLDNDRIKAFYNHVQRQLNKKNPRFSGLYPTQTDWQNIDYEAAYQTHQKLFSNANGMQFTFVGKIDEAKLKTMVERYIASLPSNPNETPHYKDLGYRADRTGQTIVFHKGHENLSLVSLNINGDAKHSAEDELALLAFGEILTIKLTEHIREIDGGVYSINADGRLHARPYGNYSLNVTFPAAPDKVDEIIKKVQAEIKQLIEQGPTTIDLEKFKKTAVIAVHENHKNNDFWTDYIQVALKRGQSPQVILNQEKLLNELSTSDVQKIGQKYLSAPPVIAILKPNKP